MNYKSAISFGLVHIPVVINSIFRDNNVVFNNIHKECGSRINFMKYCPHCDMKVSQKDLIKGYEFKDDSYVFFDNDDFDKLKTESDKIIDILAFIDIKEIDPVYFENSYVLSTNDNTRAFSLFRKALKDSKKVALAKARLRDKTYYVILRFGYNSVIMNTLIYKEEIKLDEETVKDNFNKSELDLAMKLIDSMTDKFKPEEYHDDYQDRLKEAIDNKISGKEIKQVKGKPQKSINDLMKALEESIKEKK